MRAAGKSVHVVFYDGVCGLCDRTVQFLLRIDRDRILTFAPLQGETAKPLVDRHRLPSELQTMVFAENYGTDRELVSVRSSAVLRVLGKLGGFWRLASWLRIVPSPVRDFVYRIVARHRYRWFGRFETCKLPDADVSRRFLV